MRIVCCWQTILIKYHTLFFSKIRKEVKHFVVCCSCDWRFNKVKEILRFLPYQCYFAQDVTGCLFIGCIGTRTHCRQVMAFLCQGSQGAQWYLECLTRDRGFAGSSVTSVTALCPLARYINHCLIQFQPRNKNVDVVISPGSNAFTYYV